MKEREERKETVGPYGETKVDGEGHKLRPNFGTKKNDVFFFLF